MGAGSSSVGENRLPESSRREESCRSNDQAHDGRARESTLGDHEHEADNRKVLSGSHVGLASPGVVLHDNHRIGTMQTNAGKRQGQQQVPEPPRLERCRNLRARRVQRPQGLAEHRHWRRGQHRGGVHERRRHERSSGRSSVRMSKTKRIRPGKSSME